MVVTFKEENTMSFKQIFLKDYDEGSDDTLAVYTQRDVYEHIFYAVDQVTVTNDTRVIFIRACNIKKCLKENVNESFRKSLRSVPNEHDPAYRLRCKHVHTAQRRTTSRPLHNFILYFQLKVSNFLGPV